MVEYRLPRTSLSKRSSLLRCLREPAPLGGSPEGIEIASLVATKITILVGAFLGRAAVIYRTRNLFPKEGG